jgi:hypothetical protein
MLFVDFWRKGEMPEDVQESTPVADAEALTGKPLQFTLLYTV